MTLWAYIDEENREESLYLIDNTLTEENAQSTVDSLQSLLKVEDFYDLPKKTLESLTSFCSFVGEKSNDGGYPPAKQAPKEVCGKFEEGVLVVMQREWAAATPRSFDLIGSEEATTCHIVAVRDALTGCTAMGHFDHPSTTNRGFEEMVCRLEELSRGLQAHASPEPTTHLSTPCASSSQDKSSPLDLYIVGGFDEDLSREMTTTILQLAIDSSFKFVLRLACVSDFNSTEYLQSGVAGPLYRSLALRLSDGVAFPVAFQRDTLPPACLVRAARIWGEESQSMVEVWDEQLRQLKVQPFVYQPKDYFELLLRIPEAQLLQFTSTSPLVEGPFFVQDLKRTIQFIKQNPNWKDTFPNEEPIFINRW